MILNAKRNYLWNQYQNGGSVSLGEGISIVIDADSIYSQVYSLLTRYLNDDQKAELGLSTSLTGEIKEQIAAIINRYNSETVNSNDMYNLHINQILSYYTEGATVRSEAFCPDYNHSESEADSGDTYVTTKYTIDDGSIVMVTYSNGERNVRFIINYNLYDIIAIINGNKISVDAYGFVRLD